MYRVLGGAGGIVLATIRFPQRGFPRPQDAINGVSVKGSAHCFARAEDAIMLFDKLTRIRRL